jgi:hypothetical protein
MITVQDIMSRLNVTEKQVEMAVYSGAIPAPDNIICNVWVDEERIQPYLEHWDSRLKRKREKEYYENNIIVGNMTFPTHQR